MLGFQCAPWFRYVTLFIGVLVAAETDRFPCDSKIYCHGDLLHQVQMAHLANDSKSFVDMILKYPQDEILRKFGELINDTNNNPTKNDIQKFVNDNFDERGNEFLPWDPQDWQPNPYFLSKIKDLHLRDWAKDLHSYWKQLGRMISEKVRDHPERYSQIYVPNPIIVPGGRFQEFYYWDSYWIVQGLLMSNMSHTVRGMLENFLYMVKTMGHIPNGGRVYYVHRSQPPFLIPMVNLYLEATQDVDFLRQNIHLLEKEYDFWLKNRSISVSIQGESLALTRYAVDVEYPRPESYREDLHVASMLPSENERKELYTHIHSAAETGWDFSSRWFIKNGTNEGSLKDLKTKYIVPVDLNALMCMNAKLLAKFYTLLGNNTQQLMYEEKALVLNRTIHKAFWDESRGVWLDYDMLNSKRRNYFYMSNLIPLFTDCFGSVIDKRQMVKSVLKYLEEESVLSYIGGVPTSSYPTKQQWDFPQGWPPLEHMLIVGLDAQPDADAKKLAFTLAQRWIDSNYDTYNDTGHMFEKYDVTKLGPGHGGEYDVQLGFGWTNGAVLHILDKFGDRLKANSSPQAQVMPLIVMLFFFSLLNIL